MPRATKVISSTVAYMTLFVKLFMTFVTRSAVARVQNLIVHAEGEWHDRPASGVALWRCAAAGMRNAGGNQSNGAANTEHAGQTRVWYV